MNLPQGWQYLSLKDFCKTGSGSTPSRKQLSKYYNGNIPWVKSGELKESIIFETEEYITEIALKETSVKLIPSGALLVAMYGATVGRVAILGIEATSNQAVCSIIPDELIADKRYLFYALRQQVPKWLNLRVGGAQPNISQQIIKDTKIPLPPLNEQIRIAQILDKADEIRQKRKQAINLTEELLKSTFLEIFGDPVINPKGWEVEPIKDYVIPVTTWNPLKSEKNELFTYIDISSINRETKEIEEVSNILTYEAPSRARQLVKTNDILVSTVRPNLNAVAYVNNKYNNATASTGFTVLRPNNNKLNSLYLFNWVKTQYFIDIMTQQSTGASYPAVSDTIVKNSKILLPPIELQNKFYQIVEQTTKLKNKYRESSQESENLFNSLLQRAFKGEL